MEPRINFGRAAPEVYRAMATLQAAVDASGLEGSLLELVKFRASQINGCAYCLDMHSKDARAAGETEQRLYSVSAWRETPFFSPRERAALAWTEIVTRIADDGVPDEAYDAARSQFNEAELVQLTLAIIAINGWNRLAIPFRSVPGTYQPTRR
jgi:AhpD family alkylhydroperoxidase